MTLRGMASTAQNRSQTSPPLPNEWSPRQPVNDNVAKSTVAVNGPTKSTMDCSCHNDERPPRRYDETKSSSYRRRGGTRSDHELHKLAEERTSDEGSLTDVEANDTGRGDDRPTYRNFDSAPRKCEKSPREYPIRAYGKTPDSHQAGHYEKLGDEEPSDAEGPLPPATALPPTCHRNLRDYVNSVNLPQALIAMRKLERLKDLQRRRDMSERYYSQEIKRLIGDHFFTKNSVADPPSCRVRDQRVAESGNRTIGGSSAPVEKRMRAGGISKELEPCGTMTMITRLDCGCVKETTTPIFNSSIGHVKKCEGHRYQSSAAQKFASSSPQELTYGAAQPLERLANAGSSPIRAKTRFSPESAAYQKVENTASRDLESYQDRRSRTTQPRISRSPGLHSPTRATSPVRKYSDTSSNSLRE